MLAMKLSTFMAMFLFLSIFAKIALPFDVKLAIISDERDCDIVCEFISVIKNITKDSDVDQYDISYIVINEDQCGDCNHCMNKSLRGDISYTNLCIIKSSLAMLQSKFDEKLSAMQISELKQQSLLFNDPYDILSSLDYLSSQSLIVYIDKKSFQNNADRAASKKLLLFKLLNMLSLSYRPDFISYSYDTESVWKYQVESALKQFVSQRTKTSTIEPPRLFQLEEPNISKFKIYNDDIDILISTNISDMNNSYYLCVDVAQSHFLHSKVPEDSSCVKSAKHLVIRHLKSNTYIITVSITDEKYIVIDTTCVIVEYMNSAQFFYGYDKVDSSYGSFMRLEQINLDSSFNNTETAESYLTYLSSRILPNTYIASGLKDGQVLLYWETLVMKTNANATFNLNYNTTTNITDSYSQHHLPCTILLDNGTFVNTNYPDQVHTKYPSNIVLFMNSFDMHTINQRFVYWACHTSNSSNNNYSKLKNHHEKEAISDIRVSHIITGQTETDYQFSFLYKQLQACGIPILYFPCLSLQYASLCFEILFVNNEQAEAGTDMELYALCMSCKEQIIHTLRHDISAVSLIFSNPALSVSGQGDYHSSTATDVIVYTARKYLPHILLGIYHVT